jgi:hypothetical protein
MAKRRSKNLQDAPTATDGVFSEIDKIPFVVNKKYKVQLTFLPEMEVEADNEQEAVANYNKFLGVRATTNKYSITLL